jgi:hypothetical protein
MTPPHPPCTWPSGVCQCAMQEESKPDPFGREWMHCESGLSMTAASMARFMMFCLENNVEIGQVYAFNPRHKRSLVIASVRMKPAQFVEFEAATGGKLCKPPRIKLNAEGAP